MWRVHDEHPLPGTSEAADPTETPWAFWKKFCITGFHYRRCFLQKQQYRAQAPVFRAEGSQGTAPPLPWHIGLLLLCQDLLLFSMAVTVLDIARQSQGTMVKPWGTESSLPGLPLLAKVRIQNIFPRKYCLNLISHWHDSARSKTSIFAGLRRVWGFSS